MPIQKTQAVTIIAEWRCIRRLEIRIHAMAANIENTTSMSPRMLGRATPEAALLDNAIRAAPAVEATRATHPPTCNRSPEKITAAMARSMGSVATISEACETVVRES